ncbi:calcium homeostasis modulator protein 6-like [Rhinichthys klamathensis goyatoka]|uniref:calcium homeostasis modulator protein 6-like n=1 Tax=Rhinichthys klamathensis goyatoka TaxID=3034132 RepID=UPI0024B624F1|nr:calcium homeostasis modulator protein 6-like [Rhinichthys klamathensis goyatoka]
MPPYLATDDLKELFVPAGSAFITFLFWIIFQYVFKLDFQCPCDPKENTHICVVYMIFPAISLFIVVIIANKRIRSTACSNGTGIQCKSIIILMPIIKAISVACLWIIAVLIDGDWYVCLTTTNYSLPPYEQSFCKNIKTPAEDADIRTKKSLSREIAILVLFGLSVIWTFFLAIRQADCMRPLAYQYNKILLEKTDLYIRKELKNLAKDKAKTRGQEQINNVQLFLQRADAETQQQQPEGDPSRISRSTLQAASNKANPEQLDPSSDTYTISSEKFGETADNLPLLDGKK